MEYTQNYQLPLWDKEDAVLRTDFNENNQKIDAALCRLGNCRTVCGSYTGTGSNSDTITLTFSGKPVLLVISRSDSKDTGLLIRNNTAFPIILGVVNSIQGTPTFWTGQVTWGENTIEISRRYYDQTAEQFMNANYTYNYVALLADDQ